MNTKTYLKSGAIAAAILSAGAALAGEYDGIVFCKATVVSSKNASDTLSITLPTNATSDNGEDYTYWNLGSIPAGGVADSWHADGGPGKFVAHNNGGVGTYVYLTSGDVGYYTTFTGRSADTEYIFGQEAAFDNIYSIRPMPSIKSRQYYLNSYCLAYTRDITAKIPTWHMLNMYTQYSVDSDYSNYSTNWHDGSNVYDCDVEYIGAYMGYLDAGDYMPFDVKFWAPHLYHDFDNDSAQSYSQNVRFTFMVEASTFPLWEHDRDVQ